MIAAKAITKVFEEICRDIAPRLVFAYLIRYTPGMSESKHISVFIRSTPRKIYDYVRNPQNLPKWASGLSGAIEKVGEDWVADSPMGKVKVKFAPENSFGVLDHEVTLPSGQKFLNPMRVVANGDGAELFFTLFRAPDMSEEAYLADAATITKDLSALKSLLED